MMDDLIRDGRKEPLWPDTLQMMNTYVYLLEPRNEEINTKDVISLKDAIYAAEKFIFLFQC